MNFFRRRLLFVLRLAVIAIFGLALAPTLTRLLIPASGSGPWSEICSSAGARWLASAGLSSADPTQAPVAPGKARMAHMEHCPLCAQFSTDIGLPPSQAATLQALDGADHLPALTTQAPRPRFAWAAVQARAPPRL